MEIRHALGYGPVVFRAGDLYRHDEGDMLLAYRRLLALRRLAAIAEDQLGLEPAIATLISAVMLAAPGTA